MRSRHRRVKYGQTMTDGPTTEDCIAWLERLVGYDTTSRNSNLALIDDVRETLDGLGYATRLTFNEERTKANLWATTGPPDRGAIVLSGHTDVVPVDDQDWSSDPFRLDRRDDRLYGRGAADMKGYIACVMAHAERMAASDLKTPLSFAFSYDEEVGCTGVQGLIADMRDNLPAPLAVIVGEPTSMQIVGAHKGGRGFHVRVDGVDGHSSNPDLGANAIFAAARIVSHVEAMQERFRAQTDPANGFDPYFTTVNVGTIEGGTAHNVIPALCEMVVSFRNTPDVDQDDLEAEFRRFVADEIEPKLKAVSSQAGVTIEKRFELPAMHPDEGSPAETLLRHLTGLNESGRVAYGTEAAHFQQAGVPGVIFGPGSIEQAHLPDEWIAVDQIAQCNAFLGKLTDWAARNEAIR